jgi:hypothetical protein
MGGGWSEDCERRRGFAVAEEAAGVIDRLVKFLQPNFDPFSAVERSFGEQECAADATGDAGIPARHGDVDVLLAGQGHGWFLSGDRPM